MGGVPRFLKYVFPASVNTEIAQIQSSVAAGSMILNGLYADLTGAQVSLLQQGFSSTVSLTSDNDNSGVNFTVNGYQNGVFITETIGGPNNNTVQTTGVYDVVISIITDEAINRVSSGIGTTAYFPPIKIDPYSGSFIYYMIQVYWLDDTNDLNGVIYQTIDNIVNNGLTYQAMINAAPYGPFYQNDTFDSPTNFGDFDPGGGSYLVSINPLNNQPVTLLFRQAA